VRGPRSTIDGRETVETIPVDISGSRERISQGVGLMLPDGVYATSQRTVQVSVDIRPEDED
jgi:YbbR domain-containing protein